MSCFLSFVALDFILFSLQGKKKKKSLCRTLRPVIRLQSHSREMNIQLRLCKPDASF